MADKTSKFLLSDADALRRIKFTQFRSQVPSLVILAIAIVLPNIIRGAFVYTVALLVAVLAIAWYLFVGLSHRFKQRIPLPPDGSVVSPLQGKIKFVRKNDDVTLINISKIVLDSVEIRSPHSECVLEGGQLWLDTVKGRISFRINVKNTQWFNEPDFTTGNIIGIAQGSGGCTISIPWVQELAVYQGDAVDCGDVMIEHLVTLKPLNSGEAAIIAEPETPPEI